MHKNAIKLNFFGVRGKYVIKKGAKNWRIFRDLGLKPGDFGDELD